MRKTVSLIVVSLSFFVYIACTERAASIPSNGDGGEEEATTESNDIDQNNASVLDEDLDVVDADLDLFEHDLDEFHDPEPETPAEEETETYDWPDFEYDESEGSFLTGCWPEASAVYSVENEIGMVTIDEKNGYLYMCNDEEDSGQPGLIVGTFNQRNEFQTVGYLDLGPCNTVKIEGNYAYVTYSYYQTDHKLSIIDLRNPTLPTVSGQFDFTDMINDVVVVDQTAYVLINKRELTILDVSDPVDIQKISSLDLWSEAEVCSVKKMVVYNGYVYLGGYGCGITVVNVSDPANPVDIGNFETNLRSITGMYAYGNALFADLFGYGILQFDLANPEFPTITNPVVGVIEVGSSIKGKNNLFFHLGSTQSNDIVDIFNVGANDTVQTLGQTVFYYGESTLSYARDITFTNDTVYILFKKGILRYNLDDILATPNPLGFVPDSLYIDFMLIQEDKLYTTALNKQIKTYSFVDDPIPSHTHSFGRDDLESSHLVVAENHVFRTDGALSIYDISDIDHPHELSHSGEANGAIVVRGEYAYVATGWSSIRNIQVYNISDLETPIVVAEIETDGFVRDIEVRDRYLYAVDWTGLHTFDIADPHEPVLAHEFPTIENAYNLLLAGDIAYLSTAKGEILALDLRHPDQPTLVGAETWRKCSYMESLLKIDDVLFSSCGWSGVVAFDISYPENPVFIGTLYTGKYTNWLAERNGLLYVANGGEDNRGILVFDTTGCR